MGFVCKSAWTVSDRGGMSKEDGGEICLDAAVEVEAGSLANGVAEAREVGAEEVGGEEGMELGKQVGRFLGAETAYYK